MNGPSALGDTRWGCPAIPPPDNTLGSKESAVAHPPSTLVYLERPWSEVTEVDPAVLSAAFLMGLRYPGEYWVDLAVQWAELGFPVTDEAADELKRIAASSPKRFPQQLRHRAAALLRCLGAGVAAQQFGPADGIAPR